jgi:hypothetical protein
LTRQVAREQRRNTAFLHEQLRPLHVAQVLGHIGLAFGTEKIRNWHYMGRHFD